MYYFVEHNLVEFGRMQNLYTGYFILIRCLLLGRWGDDVVDDFVHDAQSSILSALSVAHHKNQLCGEWLFSIPLEAIYRRKRQTHIAPRTVRLVYAIQKLTSSAGTPSLLETSMKLVWKLLMDWAIPSKLAPGTVTTYGASASARRLRE